MWKGLLNRPMKGGLDLTDARKRRLVEPMGSPPRANGLEAELKRRLLLVSRWKRRRRTTSMGLDRFRDSQDVFGMR